MRHDPASAAVVVMLKALKMYGPECFLGPSLWIGAETGPRAYAAQTFEVVEESYFLRGPIGASWDPLSLGFQNNWRFLARKIMGSRFGAYPHPAST